MLDLVAPSISVFPRVLRFSELRLYVFSAVFVSLGVLVPYLTHYFGGVIAGSTFLPMFFFILLAGLFAGWRAGLVIGSCTPLISFGLSGMPLLPVLPEITIAGISYGLIVGLLREKLQLKVIWALLGAIVSGWLVRLGVISLSPLLHIPYGYGGEVSPLVHVWTMIVRGLPGIAIQLALIIPIVRIAEKWYQKRTM